jgi:hypothetical protein
LNETPISSTPCGVNSEIEGPAPPPSSSSTSTSRSSSRPLRSMRRSFSRVDSADSPPLPAAGSAIATSGRAPGGDAAIGAGSSASSSRSSARCSAFACTERFSSSITSATPSSVRSRTIDSTSRPT